MKKVISNTGLRDTPNDPRTFPLGAVAGFAHLPELPNEYIVSKPIGIKDQGDTDMCTAYALSACSEAQEGVLLDPAFIFYATKQIQGDPGAWGADLLSACKAAQKFGFLERAHSTFTDPPTADERDKAVAGGYLKPGDIESALAHRKQSYFSVKSPYDMFDSIRSAMWQTRDEEREVFSGALWRPEWTQAKGGVVDKIGSPNGFGHAIDVLGWSGSWMELQLSNGEQIGDKGIFHLTREVVNDAFRYDGFTFLDMPKEQAKFEVKKNGAGLFECLGLRFDYWLKSIIS